VRAADGPGLLISPATTAAADPALVWGKKHDMPNIKLLLRSDRFAAAHVDAGLRRGFDQGGDHQQRDVQRGGRRELPLGGETTLRQFRRPKRQIKAEHNETVSQRGYRLTWSRS